MYYALKHTLNTAFFRRNVRVEYGALPSTPKTSTFVLICREVFSKFVANQSHSNENRVQAGCRFVNSQNSRHSLVRAIKIDSTKEPIGASMSQEYKIMQAQTPLFADTQKMQEILMEEAKAGWDLLEKEDNYRIKLQRSIDNRSNDGNLLIDPYRTTVGVSSVLTYGMTALATVLIVSVILYFAFTSA